jgi:hypothetical protein
MNRASRKRSKSAEKAAPTGPRPKSVRDRKTEQDTEELRRRVLRLLQPKILHSLCPPFGLDRLRIIKPSELRWEVDFLDLDGADDGIVAMAERHEYLREVFWHYVVVNDLLRAVAECAPGVFGPSQVAAFFEQWKELALFPLQETEDLGLPFTTLPWALFRRMSRVTFRTERRPAVWEIGADDARAVCAGATRHLIEIDWNEGREAVQSDLLAFIRSIAPKDLPSRRGRPKGKQLEDSLAQLVAWRARRAGLSVRRFNELLDKLAVARSKKGSREFVRRYADASAYRTAANAAEKRIRKVQRDYNSDMEKALQPNRDFWGERCRKFKTRVKQIAQEADAYRIQYEQKKRRLESLLSELEENRRKANSLPKKVVNPSEHLPR